MGLVAACANDDNVRRGATAERCDESIEAGVLAPAHERSNWIAARQDGSVVTSVSVRAERPVSGSEGTVKRVAAQRIVYYSAEGARTAVFRTPSAIPPAVSVRPALQSPTQLATVLRCADEYWLAKLDDGGAERQRFRLGQYSAVRQVVLDEAGRAFVVAVLERGTSGSVTLDSTGSTLVKNTYDARFDDYLLGFDLEGAPLFTVNLSARHALGGAFGLVWHALSARLALVSSRSATLSMSGDTDTVVSLFDAAGALQAQTVLDPQVAWTVSGSARDGAMLIAGARAPAAPQSEDDTSDGVVARLLPSSGAVELFAAVTPGADVLSAVGGGVDGSVVVAGSTEGLLDDFGGFNPEASAYLMKISAAGQQWTAGFGAAPGGVTLNAVDVDAAGNVLAAGVTSGTVTGTFEGARDLVVVKLDVHGNELWLNQGCDCLSP